MQAGISPVGPRRELFDRALTRLLTGLRVWPLDMEIAPLFGRIYQELRTSGRVLSQVDIMLAALAIQRGMTLLTSDGDFEAVQGLNRENWLDSNART